MDTGGSVLTDTTFPIQPKDKALVTAAGEGSDGVVAGGVRGAGLEPRYLSYMTFIHIWKEAEDGQ